MRPVIPLVSLLLLVQLPESAAQIGKDLDHSVDPASLSIPELYDQLDTVALHRVPVNITNLLQHFPAGSPLQMETFYQKSEHHSLLRLSKGSLMRGDRSYVYSEGMGNTYLRISDGQCFSVVAMSNEMVDQLSVEMSDLKCNY